MNVWFLELFRKKLKLKGSKVILIFENGSGSDLNHYEPISILSDGRGDESCDECFILQS